MLALVLGSLGVAALAAPIASGLGAGGIKGNYDSQTAVVSSDGRYLAFHSKASNLHPHAEGLHVFVRDLETGTTELVDRASGVEGATGNGAAHAPSISADARYVAFQTYARNLDPADSTSSTVDIYVRDLWEHTTRLVSRASGAAGPKGNADSRWPSISADGRYVAFESRATNLTADSVAFDQDNVYVRDMVAHTTTLASRANGPSGAPANSFSLSPSISADGRRVAFQSAATHLDPAAADLGTDVWVRDLDANTTTLVSRASGPTGTDDNGNAENPVISGDGTTVAFESTATNLDPADLDSIEAVYARDLDTATTSLVSRADGSAGTGANNWATYPFISFDGHTIGFSSTATNLTPDDTDPGFDVFVRDMTTAATTLVSRADGILGANQPHTSFDGGQSISADGRFVPFNFAGTGLHPDDNDLVFDVYVRDRQASSTSLESRATPGFVRYVRPKSATPVRVSLVPAYQPCATPNRTHGPPLEFGSCTPPAPTTSRLTAGVGDGAPTRARSVGWGRLAVRAGDPETDPQDEADVRIQLSITNVLRTADLSDYTGELRASVRLRLTDNADRLPGRGEETVTDLALAFTVPCVATSTTDGATCSVVTSVDSLTPGFAREGARAVYGVGRFELYDGGPDEDGDTDDNSLFAVQGVFVP